MTLPPVATRVSGWRVREFEGLGSRGRRLGVAAAMIVMTASCRSAPPPQAAPQPSAPAIRVAHVPPTPKDVIDAVLASSRVPLRTATNCTNVGTEPTDETIGRYLAGFLAELSSADKKNWIETRIEPGRSAAGEPVSICTLTLRHQDGDDRWGWGIQFRVRSSDGLVLADSYACVGAG